MKIETGIPGLTISHNPVVSDTRGTLFPLAFEKNIANLIAVIAEGKEPRGAHYQRGAEKDIWHISGMGLYYFLDLQDESPTKGKSFACIIGYQEDAIPVSLRSLPTFFIQKNKATLHIHGYPGIYDLIWPLGTSPLIFVESKTMKYDERDYMRIPPDTIAEVRQFASLYGLDGVMK